MFTLDDIFNQIFPWMEGISIDLGTILIALVFLSFLLLGFDWVMEMLGTRIGGRIADRNHGYFMDEAAKHEKESMLYADGSIQRSYHEGMMKSYISDAVRAKRRR